MNPYIDQVGPYKIARTIMPHFNEPWDANDPRAGVLHTTEGDWDSSMGVFHVHYAPQFIVGVDAHHIAAQRVIKSTGASIPPPEPVGDAQIAQLVAIGTIGAALRTHNNEALVQIEVIGYSREEPWCFEAGTLEALAQLMAALERDYGIPLSRPWPDGVYGRAGVTTHRNDGHFGKIAGWFGHGDVPSPDTHWDPGNLQWSKLFDRAKVINGALTS